MLLRMCVLMVGWGEFDAPPPPAPAPEPGALAVAAEAPPPVTLRLVPAEPGPAPPGPSPQGAQAQAAPQVLTIRVEAAQAPALPPLPALPVASAQGLYAQPQLQAQAQAPAAEVRYPGPVARAVGGLGEWMARAKMARVVTYVPVQAARFEAAPVYAAPQQQPLFIQAPPARKGLFHLGR